MKPSMEDLHAGHPVRPGVNALACPCGGTGLVSVTMDMISKLKLGSKMDVVGPCTKGHDGKYKIRA